MLLSLFGMILKKCSNGPSKALNVIIGKINSIMQEVYNICCTFDERDMVTLITMKSMWMAAWFELFQ